MIVGIGLDIASIARIEESLERFGDRFTNRILTAAERAQLSERGPLTPTTLAGRFAAKEALFKALGGPPEVGFQDVEVRRGPLGEPSLELHGAAATHASRQGVVRALVSITHDAGVAAAVVVLEAE